MPINNHQYQTMFHEKTSIKPSMASTKLFSWSVLIIALDQYLKHKIHLNGGFYVCNGGISFGLPLSLTFFWLLLITALSLFFSYYKYLLKNSLLSPLLLLTIALIIGGAISNSIDRLLVGCVVDFLRLPWITFPFFNLADMAIFSGSCLLLLALSSKHPRNSA